MKEPLPESNDLNLTRFQPKLTALMADLLYYGYSLAMVIIILTLNGDPEPKRELGNASNDDGAVSI